jgi:cytochrome c-type biogenesis protein
VNLSLGFIRGMIAAVNPCGFILLPTYLLYFLGISGDGDGAQRAPVRRALVVSAAVSGGFLSVFLAVGIVTQAFTNWINEHAKYATAVIGIGLIVLGASMLFGYRLPFTTPKLDAGGRDRTVGSMFVYGVAYAVASIGCTIGLFMSTLFGTAERAGYLSGVATIAAYGLGMALLVSALTVTLAVAQVGLLRVLRRGMQYVDVVAGAFVVLSGVYLLWYFWKVDLREEGDPISDAVARYQTDISGFLDENWRAVAVVLATIVCAAIAWTALARRTGNRVAE